MNSDSKNALINFDLCMTLSEQAINTQMETAWESWKARKKWTDEISVFLKTTNKKGVLTTTKQGIKAKMAPMQISLDVTDGKFAQVKVTITLESGKVFYYDMANPGEVEEEDIDNWSFSFIADLDKQPLDLDMLKKIDPAAVGEVKDLLKNVKKAEGISDSVFSIEYLFMNFTKVDLLVTDNKLTNIPGTVSTDAGKVGKMAINTLLNGEFEGKFMLGTVVRRTDRTSAPTFAMTNFIFHVHTHPTLNTLDYLGVFSNKALPQNITAERANLTHPWIQADLTNGKEKMLHGAMIISKKSFVDNYLMENVKNALAANVTATRDLNHHFASKRETKMSKDLVLIAASLEDVQGWEMDLHIEPTTNTINVSGKVYTKLYMDISIPVAPNGYMHTKGHQKFSGTIKLTGNTPMDANNFPEPEKFKIGIAVDINFEPVVIDENETDGITKFGNILQGFMKDVGIIGKTAEDQVKNKQKDDVKAISETLRKNFDKLSVNIKDYAFIPPGGGVFSYQNPHFSSAGDLYIDAIYHVA